MLIRIFLLVSALSLFGCSHWTLRDKRIDLSNVQADGADDLKIEVYWDKSNKKATPFLKNAVAADISKVKKVLKKRGISSVIVTVTISKNVENLCYSCVLSAYIIPDYETRIIEVVWYSEDSSGDKHKITSNETQWKTFSWFFMFPFMIPSVISDAISYEWDPDDSIFYDLGGMPRLKNVLINLNREIVYGVLEGSVVLEKDRRENQAQTFQK
ncbi:hypothetical protein [Bdellovibrio bacteriovorus]|uniref:hypothetical protein n=1 Tax=Bdellovibrio bacteriovorus TaxID=959 RepID=UPI0035A64C2A